MQLMPVFLTSQSRNNLNKEEPEANYIHLGDIHDNKNAKNQESFVVKELINSCSKNENEDVQETVTTGSSENITQSR